MENILANKLNSTAKGIEKLAIVEGEFQKKFAKDCNEVNFFSLQNFEQAVKGVAPYLKVAFLCRQRTFLNGGRIYVDKLKSLGNKTICLILQDDFILTVSNACGVFSLAEDIRAVLVVEPDLYNLALYFGSIRGIGVIFVTDCLYPQLFSSQIFISNGEYLDKFSVDVQRQVILSNFDCKKNSSFILAMQLSLSEYLAFDPINSQEERDDFYHFLRQKNGNLSVESLFSLYYIDLILDGKIFQNSSLTELSLLLGGQLTDKIVIYLTKKIIKGLIRSQSKEIIDYNKLAKKIHLITGEKLSTVVKRINKSLKTIDENKQKLFLSKKKLISLIADLKETVDKWVVQKNLQSIDIQKKIDAVYSLGGYTLGVNALTIIQEKILNIN